MTSPQRSHCAWLPESLRNHHWMDLWPLGTCTQMPNENIRLCGLGWVKKSIYLHLWPASISCQLTGIYNPNMKVSTEMSRSPAAYRSIKFHRCHSKQMQSGVQNGLKLTRTIPDTAEHYYDFRKRRQSWRRFDVIIMLLLRRVSAGVGPRSESTLKSKTIYPALTGEICLTNIPQYNNMIKAPSLHWSWTRYGTLRHYTLHAAVWSVIRDRVWARVACRRRYNFPRAAGCTRVI